MLTPQSILDSDMWTLGFFQPDEFCSGTKIYHDTIRTSLFKHIQQFVSIDRFKYPDQSVFNAALGDKVIFRLEVRSPDFNARLPVRADTDICDWHRDLRHGIEKTPRDVYLMVWSNSVSTEFKRERGKVVYAANPGEVILFNNNKWVHRTPRMTKSQKQNRWFARFYLCT